jgi:hypothetical protein
MDLQLYIFVIGFLCSRLVLARRVHTRQHQLPFARQRKRAKIRLQQLQQLSFFLKQERQHPRRRHWSSGKLAALKSMLDAVPAVPSLAIVSNQKLRMEWVTQNCHSPLSHYKRV